MVELLLIILFLSSLLDDMEGSTITSLVLLRGRHPSFHTFGFCCFSSSGFATFTFISDGIPLTGFCFTILGVGVLLFIAVDVDGGGVEKLLDANGGGTEELKLGVTG